MSDYNSVIADTLLTVFQNSTMTGLHSDQPDRNMVPSESWRMLHNKCAIFVIAFIPKELRIEKINWLGVQASESSTKIDQQ